MNATIEMRKSRLSRNPEYSLGLALMLASVLQAQETVFPSEYYPAYPGSWWKYKTTSQDSAGAPKVESEETIRVLPQYCLTQYLNGDFCDHTFRFVPMQTSGSFDSCSRYASPIYGSQSLASAPPDCGFLEDYILTEVGKTWSYSGGGDVRCGITCPVRTVVSADTSLVLSGVRYDSLLHIHESRPLYGYYTDQFFQKNVGLIFQSNFRSYKSASSEMELVEYRINPDRKRDQVIIPESPGGTEAYTFWPDEWGNAGSFYLIDRYGVQDKAMNLSIGPGSDTVQIRAHTSSGLPIVISVNGGNATLLGTDRVVLENRWYGFRVEMKQTGNDEFRPAPIFKGRVCITPELVAELDTSRNALWLHGFPDSLVYWWRWAEGGNRDSVGRGSLPVPAQHGTYFASIPDGSLRDSICGASRELRSNEISIEPTVFTRSRDDGGAGLSLRIFGKTLSTRIPAHGAGRLRVRVTDMRGKSFPITVKVAGSGMLDAVPAESPEAGLYFYSLEADGRRDQGRFFFPGVSRNR